ncbi:hypothetical protein [Nostoc linckia]|uniref:hypothetical protein n=1 Tax=Nostoc linckia TaxID=92942 RepID=UPI00117BFF4D|nr:hypothetical protein [Nostoc linckia]
MRRQGRGGRQGEKSERRFPTIRTSKRKIATLSLLSSVRRSLLAFLKEDKPTLASLLKLRYRRKLGVVTSLLVFLPLSPSSFHYPLPTFADRH